MIKIFNDTNVKWNTKANQNNTTRISAGAKVDNQFKGVSINAPTEGLNNDAIKNAVNTDGFVTVYDGDTSVYYGRLDNLPNVGTNGAKKKNFYLISKNIQGCKIREITNQDVFIFSYRIVKGILYLILSVKEDTCSEFKITLYNKDTSKDITTTFNVKTGKVTTTESANKTTAPELYKIRSMRPSRPTTAIIVREDIVADMKPELTDPVKHVLFKYTEDTLSDTISNALREKYTAITIFTNLEDVINDNFGDFDDAVTLLRTSFNQVNIILGGRPSPKIVKR
jgi:hypothetical protein